MEARLKQELPAIPQKIQAQLSGWANRTDVYQVNSVDAYISAIRAESAALHETIATLRADASKAAEELTRVRAMARRIERDRDDWARECGKVQIELARERERHQWIEIKEGCDMPKNSEDVQLFLSGEVVSGYYVPPIHRASGGMTLGGWMAYSLKGSDDCLPTHWCHVANPPALLEPQPAPVATGEEK